MNGWTQAGRDQFGTDQAGRQAAANAEREQRQRIERVIENRGQRYSDERDGKREA